MLGSGTFFASAINKIMTDDDEEVATDASAATLKKPDVSVAGECTLALTVSKFSNVTIKLPNSNAAASHFFFDSRILLFILIAWFILMILVVSVAIYLLHQEHPFFYTATDLAAFNVDKYEDVMSGAFC